MDFEWSEEQRLIGDTLHRYLTDRYPFEERQRIAASAEGYDTNHWRALAEMGITGMLFSEEHGGFGGSGFDILLIFEELGKALVVEPWLPTLMAGRVLALAGNAEQRHWLAEAMEGHTRLAFAHAEPDSDYDPACVTTRARATDDGWVLDGAKAIALQAETADRIIVSARTAGDVREEDGISLFALAANTPGLTLRGYPLADGGRAAELTLRQVKAGAENLIGEPGTVFACIEAARAAGILALCAESLGCMEMAKQCTLEYLQTRKQFGHPIGSFQALQHRIVDVMLEIEQMRSAAINAAAAFDGTDATRRERLLAAAKYTAGKVGLQVAEEAIQLHGGIGMTREAQVAHYAKRLVMIDHQLGDMDYQLARYDRLGKLA